MRGDDHRRGADQHDRREILQRIERQIGQEARIGAVGVEHQHERGAVRRRRDGGLRADRAGRAAAVLDQDRRFQVPLEHRLDAPRDQVGGAARRERNDDAQRFSAARPGRRRGGQARGSRTSQQQGSQPRAAICSLSPSRRLSSCQRCCWQEFSHSLGRSPLIDFDRACLDPRNELAAELDRVVERVEAADQKRVHPERVVFQDRVGDLLRSADET